MKNRRVVTLAAIGVLLGAGVWFAGGVMLSAHVPTILVSHVLHALVRIQC